MHDYYDYEEEDIINRKTHLNFNKKIFFIVIGVVFLVIFGMGYYFLSNNQSNSSYTNYEKELIRKAKEYVEQNNISVSNEVYFDVSTLNMEIPNNCSILSGVLYNGNRYNAYLSCSDYESEVYKNSGRNISLLGDNIYVLTKNMTFYDPGYVSNGDVTVSGSVGTEEGVYTIYYSINNDFLYRKIIIIDKNEYQNKFPSITLNGNDYDTIIKNNSYIDPGVRCYDNVDGDISDNVIKSSNVDISKPSEYIINYQIKNSQGYKSNITRRLIVLNNNSDFNVMINLDNYNMTNQNVKIIVNVLSKDYSYTLLPNNVKEYRKDFEYIVEENGEYTLQFFDNSGNITTRNVNISNINKTIPIGTCTATILSDKTTVNVIVPEELSVYGYNYVIDDVSSGYRISNNYRSNNININSIKVIVKNTVGNENEINCDIIDNHYTYNPNGYTRVINGQSMSRIREPIANLLAKNNHSVTDLNKCIENRVKEAGPGTRYGVVAAAYGLIDCSLELTGRVLSYDHEGGKVEFDGKVDYCSFNKDICGKLGINTRWGYSGGACRSDNCWYGLNCATFVRWAMCNGGMDLCTKGTAGAYSMTNVKYFKEADGVYINGNRVTYYSGNNLTGYSASTLVRMIKPGDIVARVRNDDTNGDSQHTFVVVGKDDNGIYAANDGYFIDYITYKYMINGETSYRILFLDNYYANKSNRNNLYGE